MPSLSLAIAVILTANKWVYYTIYIHEMTPEGTKSKKIIK
jgi:hypothetical protein